MTRSKEDRKKNEQTARRGRVPFALVVRKRLKTLLKYVAVVLAVLVVAAVIYGAVAMVLAFVPVNEEFRNAADGIEVFLVSNGVHVDVVLPVRSRINDWAEQFPRDAFTGVGANHQYVAFGWGDRQFYLDTPAWSDLQMWTAARAVLWPTETVMHVEYIDHKPALDDHTRRVVLSRSQYETLVQAIHKSFRTEVTGRFLRIEGRSYGDTDGFYEGTGSYHAFNTCNMWTNGVLKETGVRTAMWSPFAEGILYQSARIKGGE